MSPVALASRPIERRRTRAAIAAVLVAGAIAMSFGLTELLRPPEFVDHVTVDNRTAFDFDVTVGDGRGRARVGIGVAAPNQRTRVDDVTDQGDTWVFVFSRADRQVGRIERTRGELEAANWRVVVPIALSDRLMADGQVPLR